MDCSPPGSSVHGILRARVLEWAAMPSSRGSSWPRDWTRISYVSCIGRRVLYHWCHVGRPGCSPRVKNKCFLLESLFIWSFLHSVIQHLLCNTIHTIARSRDSLSFSHTLYPLSLKSSSFFLLNLPLSLFSVAYAFAQTFTTNALINCPFPILLPSILCITVGMIFPKYRWLKSSPDSVSFRKVQTPYLDM